MAAAIAAVPLLIDISCDLDEVQSVTEHVDNLDESEDSTASEASSRPTDVQIQHDVLKSRRELLNDFLSTTKTKESAATARSCLDLDDKQVRLGKIIDEVRQYQQELFERALEENVIAVLDTGSGKTLIACLLVRHVLEKELISRGEGHAAKIIFFLANSVHLVQQQARVLENNLLNKPFVFVGNDKVETWKSRQIWPEIFQKSVPIVCTPAVLQQCLDAGLVRIEQISLLVFDEAHHAKKDHPYSRIIRSHYLHCDPSHRPRIFGMTASPVDSKGDVNTNITNLEQLLHSKIVTARDPSRLSFVPKPKDVIWRYRRPGPEFETNLCRSLKTKASFSQDVQKGLIFARHAASALGTWCADRAWNYIIGTSEHEAMTTVKRFEQSPAFMTLDDDRYRENAIGSLQEVIAAVLEQGKEIPNPDPLHLSSKVLLLYEELHKIYCAKPGTRGIVFVDQRLTARVLNDCFTKLQIPNLRTGLLLGAAQDSTSLKKQEAFLGHFRAGLINLIFATSVADEGIDIPQCNLCVRFDLYKSPIQYIQSRGRARMENSMYAHMIEEGNARHEKDVSYALESDLYLREYCEQLDPQRLLGRGTKLDRMLNRDSTDKRFKTETGAICDFANSLLILSRFASSLYYLGSIEKEAFEEEIDEVNKLFRCTVRLPQVQEVGLKGARGEWRSNKLSAKRSAAYNCCWLLRKKGLLDDELNSPFRKVRPDNLNARLAISEKKSAYKMLTKPDVWQVGLGDVPTSLYTCIIHLKPSKPLRRAYAPVVLFTKALLPQLPAFNVYLEHNIETEVVVNIIPEFVTVSTEEIDLLTAFTLKGVFLDVFNKTYDIDSARPSYWLAPLRETDLTRVSQLSDLVDVGMMAAIHQGRITWHPACPIEGAWTEKFICDPRDGMYHYFTGSIAQGVNIYDPVPSTVPHIARKGRKNIIDFSDSYWRASKQNFAEASYDVGQPVLKAELLMARRDFLSPSSDIDRSQVKCLIAPQPLEVSRLDPAFAASCLVWPSIIHRIEAYLLSLEAFEKLELPGVPADLALEAFTKGSDSESHDLQTHTASHHGMGKNYERLEFIGDSLLKMMTTITVFNRTKCDEEGMHCRRMEILCNRRLFDVSTQKHHLYQYVRTNAFNRVTWYPENLILLKGRGAKKTPEPIKHAPIHQDLGMKTIADVSEAIIGAAVVASKHASNNLDLGIKAITALVDSEDHAITTWSEIIEMYEAPAWTLKTDDFVANKLAEDVARRTGYQFKHPRLLRSAFTHSSEVQATVPDLQRLEFLGDAVLDWVSISWLFNTNPDRNPQWLTEHKMAMVSNKFLAALAVVLEFDKMMRASTAQLLKDVDVYARRIREARNEESVSRDFWVHIDSPPKALSDLVEAYIGAVLVDSSFDYHEIEKFFNAHVLWFFEDIESYDGFANRHPTTFLYKKVTDEFKCRDCSVIASDTDDGQVETEVTAGVLIHNTVIADASGTSARYAKVRASKKALAKLEGMGIEEFRKTFGCYCKLKD